ncbi:hypothetical protein D3C87_2163930 [compost metagenome]
MQHLVNQQAGIAVGVDADELAFRERDFPALRASGFAALDVQDADQQPRLGVVHMLLNPRH